MKRKKRKKRLLVDPTEEAKQAVERVNKFGRLLGAHPRTDQVINPTFGTTLFRTDENDNPVRKPDFWDILFTPQIEVEIRQARAERLVQIENNHKVK